ncbi:MAG: hypothetical protein AAFV72_09395, partial [Cyanobacteria bacterium J06635_1]
RGLNVAGWFGTSDGYDISGMVGSLICRGGFVVMPISGSTHPTILSLPTTIRLRRSASAQSSRAHVEAHSPFSP